MVSAKLPAAEPSTEKNVFIVSETVLTLLRSGTRLGVRCTTGNRGSDNAL